MLFITDVITSYFMYDADIHISTSTPTINQGETVGIAYGGSNLGSTAVDIVVFDQDGHMVFDHNDMDILYFG